MMMNSPEQTKRFSPNDIHQRKNPVQPIVCLTAYSAPIAALIDPFVDLILVGDSMGMVLYGMDNTLGVTLDMIIAHGKAVVSKTTHACIVVDMPYGTYEGSPTMALDNAKTILDSTHAQAVKLEGGIEMAETIHHLTQNNIPVMGHIGLKPQSVVKEGGFKIKGKTQEQTNTLIADAKAIAEAGAFAFVLEGTCADSATQITESVDIPSIGIGASLACDGQILVTEDILGLSGEGNLPKFVKPYANLKPAIQNAVNDYATEVKNREFPSDHYLYHRPKEKGKNKEGITKRKTA